MILTRRGFNGRSLLAEAAFRGDMATFEAVLGALRTRLHEQEVILRTQPQLILSVAFALSIFLCDFSF